VGKSAARITRRNRAGETTLRTAELMLSNVIAARRVWPTLTQMRVGLALGRALPVDVLAPETQINPP
jgi:hypothetical protein